MGRDTKRIWKLASRLVYQEQEAFSLPQSLHTFQSVDIDPTMPSDMVDEGGSGTEIAEQESVGRNDRPVSCPYNTTQSGH